MGGGKFKCPLAWGQLLGYLVERVPMCVVRSGVQSIIPKIVQTSSPDGMDGRMYNGMFGILPKIKACRENLGGHSGAVVVRTVGRVVGGAGTVGALGGAAKGMAHLVHLGVRVPLQPWSQPETRWTHPVEVARILAATVLYTT